MLNYRYEALKREKSDLFHVLTLNKALCSENTAYIAELTAKLMEVDVQIAQETLKREENTAMGLLHSEKWRDTPFAGTQDNKYRLYSREQQDKHHAILRPSTVCNTTVDVSIHALAIALVFKHMQTQEGRALLAEIVEKALPEDMGLLSQFALQQVEGHGNTVTFSFEAKAHQLAVSDPTQYEVNEPFTINHNELLSLVHNKKSPWESLEQQILPIWNGDSPVKIETQKADILKGEELQKLKEMLAQSLLPPSWAPKDEQKAARKNTKGKALTLLTHSNQTVSNGTYTIIRSSTDGYIFYTSDTDGEPAMKVFLATNEDELRTEIKRLETEAYQSQLDSGTSYGGFVCDLDSNEWFALD